MFFLFLASFYFLYVLIDYSSHASMFHNAKVGLKEIIIYYCCHFVWRLEILVPCTLMLATIRTCCLMNINSELVALLAGGLSRKTIVRPLITIGLICTLGIILNFQFSRPAAIHQIQYYETEYFGRSASNANQKTVHQLIMRDQSRLFYHHHNKATGKFHGVFWVRSLDDIYRIRTLEPFSTYSIGHHVDHLKRDEKDHLVLAETFETLTLSGLGMSDDVIGRDLEDPDLLSLSELWEALPSSQQTFELSDGQADIVSQFHYKLATPWLCMLAILGPIPFCLRFTRHLNVFIIFGIFIIFFISFIAILIASMKLGKNQIISPELGAWTPLLLGFIPALSSYIRMK